MRRIIIDTNGFLRVLLDDIPEQANQVESVLKRASKGELEVFLPQIIVFEIIFALDKYYRLDKKELIDKVESLVSIGYIEVESKEVFIQSLDLYKRSSISFVNCFLLSKARDENALDVIANAKTTHKSVFVACGGSHAVTWEPALQANQVSSA
jgi:predicted nucleic-acid-binding protein